MDQDEEGNGEPVPAPIEELSPAEMAGAALKNPKEMKNAHMHGEADYAIQTIDFGNGAELKLIYSVDELKPSGAEGAWSSV